MARSVEKSKSKKTMIIVIVVVLIAAAAGGYFIYKAMSTQKDFVFDELAQDGFLEGRTEDEIQELINQAVEDGMFNISVNSNPVFENGKAEGSLRIENVPNNKYYMKVTVKLDDTGEIVYESKGIKQGQYIEKATLTKALAKGEYAATAVFTAVNPQTLAERGTASAQIQLSVLN